MELNFAIEFSMLTVRKSNNAVMEFVASLVLSTPAG